MDNHFKNESRVDELWMLVRLGYSELPPQAQRMLLSQLILNEGKPPEIQTQTGSSIGIKPA